MEREPGTPPDIEINPNPAPPPPVEPKKAVVIAIPEGQTALAPADHNQLLAFIDRMIEAKSVPKHFTNRLQVFAAWNYAAQLKLPPQPSLRNIAVIDGVPSLFGDLPLSLAQNHPDFKFYNEYVITEDYLEISVANRNLDAPIFSGVVEMQRKGMAKPTTYTFTIKDAETAGLIRWNDHTNRWTGVKRDGTWKDGSPWTHYLGTMLIRRARGKAVKAHFADALCGAGIAEYDHHIAPDLEELREVNDSERPMSPEFGSKIDQLD